jgi:chemotaxis protein methyltransferase CheR
VNACRDQKPSRPVVSAVPEMSLREFNLFRELIRAETGIFLSDVKRTLLQGRLLRRVRDLDLGSFGQYYDVVTSPSEQTEFVRMLDLVTTNETHFFREPHHFEYLERKLIPEWETAARSGEREKHIRIWSAGCSSGEEPFSMAMVLLAHLPPAQGWDVQILASDLSTRVLDAARSATWSIDKATSIPERFLKSFMLRGVGPSLGQLRAGPELREVIRFERINLANVPRLPDGPFDIVLCRNVLIYFDPQKRAEVIDRLVAQLKPGGAFLVGHAESVRAEGRLLGVHPTIYRAPPLRGMHPSSTGTNARDRSGV